MDMYTRNVEVIEHAFNQIEKATGISSVEEIVTTFIKAEEQNYSLFNYVNMLNSDIDLIEDQNKSIQQQIMQHRLLKKMTDATKKKYSMTIESEIANHNAAIVDCDKQISGIEN